MSSGFDKASLSSKKQRISVPAITNSKINKQILHLDPALIHRAMHEDIKGALPVP
jgi:hypothetical protein